LRIWWKRNRGRKPGRRIRQDRTGTRKMPRASSPPFYNLLKLKASAPYCRPMLRFVGRIEDVAQVDFVELHRGLGGRLERGFHLRGLMRGGLESLREAKAQRGERLRVGLFLVGRGGRAVDALRHADENGARELEVWVLKRRGERGFLVLAGLVGVAHAAERS